MLLSILTLPTTVRQMQILDKTLFNGIIKIPTLDISGTNPSSVIPLLKTLLLKLRHFKPIQTNNSAEKKEMHILLNPTLVKDWNSIDKSLLQELENKSITKNKFSFKEYNVTYDNWTAEEILKSVLPDDKEGTTSFTQIGHIVHINLREHLLDYKKLIGQVLLDKVPNCKTVVNKMQNIDNTYRNFEMEVLAGDNDMRVKLKENLCTFEFDFSTVYWNSRLGKEHERIVEKLSPENILFDVFAGVGPFSIPAAKKKCIVYANDLNPESFKWLNHNIKINKISPDRIKTSMKDGRDFIKNEIYSNLLSFLKQSKDIHIVMNLPAIAVEFLNDFVGLYKEEQIPNEINSPIVHVYCFIKTMEDPVPIAKELAEKYLGCSLDDKLIEIFKVRTVSNYKEMMKISFKLTRNLLIGRELKKRKFEDEENTAKKFNLDS